jgi:hypothetical protein
LAVDDDIVEDALEDEFTPEEAPEVVERTDNGVCLPEDGFGDNDEGCWK